MDLANPDAHGRRKPELVFTRTKRRKEEVLL
jgi:hypothetical protein